MKKLLLTLSLALGLSSMGFAAEGGGDKVPYTLTQKDLKEALQQVIKDINPSEGESNCYHCTN